LDRPHDLLVLRAYDHRSLLGFEVLGPGDLVENIREDLDQLLVTGDLGNPEMEAAIQLGAAPERLLIGRGEGDRAPERLQLLEFRAGDFLGGNPGTGTFENQTQLVDVLDLLHRNLGDKEALVRYRLEQAVFLQELARFAHRRPARLVTLRQRELGNDGAGRRLAGDDFLLHRL